MFPTLKKKIKEEKKTTDLNQLSQITLHKSFVHTLEPNIKILKLIEFVDSNKK